MQIDGLITMSEGTLLDYLSRHDCLRAPFRAKIFQRDEMFHNTVAKVIKDPATAEFRYYDSGFRSFSIIKQICDAYFSGTPGKMLEFASGAGRLTRWLTSWLPSGCLDCTDIYEDAVEFQRDYFGTDAFLSVLNPAEFRTPSKYDILYAGSFYTHMPDHLFNDWLKVMGDIVHDNGLICFTTRNDYSNVGQGYRGEMPDEGILFKPLSESDVLAHEVYGITVVTEQYVRDAIRKNIGQNAEVVCIRKAMYENQDLYIVSRKPRVALDTLNLDIVPLCSFGWTREIDGEIQMGGWAIDVSTGGEIKSVTCGIVGGPSTEAALLPANDAILRPFPATPIEAAARWQATLPASEGLAYADVTTISGATNRCYPAQKKAEGN